MAANITTELWCDPCSRKQRYVVFLTGHKYPGRRILEEGEVEPHKVPKWLYKDVEDFCKSKCKSYWLKLFGEELKEKDDERHIKKV